ncbi:hypothetical protein NLU13_1637 [Sarocladium strictum]|uniref:Microsomal glutathione S-transferase 3 n=1 Tax=Sarocladium strictum TaxID=5046 RepID=A0AA39GTC0_SARSR|nr:hypothetical protein NLU13_1637 [Sarocladium strictum]
MPTTIVLPDNYGLVLGVAVSSLFVNFFHVMKVVNLRQKFGIKGPAVTAGPEHLKKNPESKVFDCAFRAHANYTENLPSFLTSLAITGLRYPTLSAVAGGIWILGRIIYLYGYINTGNSAVKSRAPGFIIAAYTQLVLMCSAAYAAYTFIF